MKLNVTTLNRNPRLDLREAFGVCTGRIGHKLPPYFKNCLKYLEAGHETPAEHIVLKVECLGLAYDAVAQLTRHRIASFCVKSRRYTLTKLLNEYGQLQAECDQLDFIKTHFDVEYPLAVHKAVTYCSDLLKHKALNVDKLKLMLPAGIKTDFIMTINVRSLANLLKLRMAKGAQAEIREFATELYEQIAESYPDVYKMLVALGVKDYGKQN